MNREDKVFPWSYDGIDADGRRFVFCGLELSCTIDDCVPRFSVIARPAPHDGGRRLTAEQYGAVLRHAAKHEPVLKKPVDYPPRGWNGRAEDLLRIMDELGLRKPVPDYVADLYRAMTFDSGKPVEPPKPPPLRYVLENRDELSLDDPGWQREFEKLNQKPATTTHDAIYRARQLYFSGRPR